MVAYMSNYTNLSVLLIRFRLSEEADEKERLSSIGITEEQIFEATINDTLTSGIAPGIDFVLLKLDECGRFNWQQLYNFLDATFTLRVPVLVCYDKFQQYQDVSELTSSYTHTVLIANDEGMGEFDKSVKSLIDDNAVEWNGENDKKPEHDTNNDDNKDSNKHIFSYLAHEIKTPLSAVIGYTEELLEKDQLDNKTRSDLKKIYSNSYQVLHVMNSVMEFPGQFLNERIDQLETVHVDELIDEIVDWHDKELENEQVELIPRVDKELNDGIMGEEGNIRQILINLVNNAIDHTDKGKIDITADLVKYKEIDDVRENADHVSLDKLNTTSGSPLLKMEVKDEGTGIEASFLEDIFLPGVSENGDNQIISRNDESDSSSGSNSSNFGLGLSVIHQLTEQLNGFLAVNSEPGKGSNFVVILPYEVITNNSDNQEELNSSEDESGQTLFENIHQEAKDLGDNWFEEFQEAIEGLDLNQIIMLCDRNVDDKPALTNVFEAAVFKDFQYLVEVQSAFFLEEPETSDKTNIENSKSLITGSMTDTNISILPDKEPQNTLNGNSKDERMIKKLEAI